MPVIGFSARTARLIERFVDAVENITAEIARTNDLRELDINVSEKRLQRYKEKYWDKKGE